MSDIDDLARPRPSPFQRSAAEKAIADKHAALNGAPGAAVGGLEQVKAGFIQRYASSAIGWIDGVGAFWVLGGIYERYVAMGGPGGLLGFPVTDETATGDTVGRFTHFEGGSIYWHPSTGAHEVHGAIRELWQRIGSEGYGYPITDETPTEAGGGRFNHFRSFGSDGAAHDASIYWTPTVGAHTVYGAIRDRWLGLGESHSYLGFPVTEEMDWTDPDTQEPGRVTHFERGAIAWVRRDGTLVEFPARLVFRSGHIGVSAVGGWAELTLTSTGTFFYRGHLHNSGFVGLSCTVGSAVKVPGTNAAVVAQHEGNAGGTTSVDSRDEDWDESGFSHDVRANWDALGNADSMSTTVEATLGGFEVVTLVLLPIVGATIVWSLVTGPSAPDTVCQTTGSHTVRDGNNRTVIEADGVRCHRP